jgi:hypothetical protein
MDQRSRRAVEFAERYADGEAPQDEEPTRRHEAEEAYRECRVNGPSQEERAAWLACYANGYAMTDPEHVLGEATEAAHLREILGNPFRPAAFDPAWRTPLVVSLAEAAYQERLLPSGELDPQRLAVFADALEEAGAGGELLAHLRGPGPHVRGCHAVDLILGKS